MMNIYDYGHSNALYLDYVLKASWLLAKQIMIIKVVALKREGWIPHLQTQDPAIYSSVHCYLADKLIHTQEPQFFEKFLWLDGWKARKRRQMWHLMGDL